MAHEPHRVEAAARLFGMDPHVLQQRIDAADARAEMRGGDDDNADDMRPDNRLPVNEAAELERAAELMGVEPHALQQELENAEQREMIREANNDEQARTAARRRVLLQVEEREHEEYAAHQRAQLAEDRARSERLKRRPEPSEGEASKLSKVDKKREKLPVNEEEEEDRTRNERNKVARSDLAPDTPMPHAAYGERLPRGLQRKRERKKRIEGAAGKQEKIGMDVSGPPPVRIEIRPPSPGRRLPSSLEQDAPGLDALVEAADKAGMELVDVKVEPTYQPTKPSDMEIPLTVEIPRPPVIHKIPPTPTSDSAPPPEVPEFGFVPVHPAPAHAHVPTPPIVKAKKRVRIATGADDNSMPAAPPTAAAAAAPPVIVVAAPPAADTAMPEAPEFGPISLNQHIRNHPAMKTSRGTPVTPPTPPTPTLAVAPPVKPAAAAAAKKHHEPHVGKPRSKKATKRPTHSPASTYEHVDWEEKRRVAEAQIKAYEEKMKLLKQESEMSAAAAQPTRPPAAAAAAHSQPSEEYHHHRPHQHQHHHDQLVVVHNPRRGGWIHGGGGDEDEGMPEVPGHLPRVVTTTTTKSY